MKRRLLPLIVLCACSSGLSPSTGGGTGGSGTGGEASGTGGEVTGTGGAGGRDAAVGTGGAVADAAADVAGREAGLDTASPEAGAGKSLDECFAGLRTLGASFQVATRASSDGRYRMRLALETGMSGGTSGTLAWSAVRFGLEGPEGRVCVADEKALAAAGVYAGSHHNCNDVLTVTAEGRRYVVQNPDSARDYADPTRWRRLARLTVWNGATMIAGPIDLPTVACDRGTCSSGGPCM